jgi:hypothetical protein
VLTSGAAQERGRLIAERVGRAVAWVSRHRYMVLSFVLLVLATRVALEQRWGALLDIWEHAAVARELALHPWHPHHPQLALPTTPHAFFSPYLLAVGLFARVTGMQVPAALALFGLVNLLLFLALLERVVAGLVGGPHAAFWTLLFTLLLWGADPWFFSSFLHANVFFDLLPYPAMFACVMVLLAFSAQIRVRRLGNPRWAALVVAAATIVLLTHASDAVFLYLGLAAIAVGVPSRRSAAVDVALTAATGVVAFLVAAAWPYFPFLEVFFGKGDAVFRAGVALADQDMYARVLSRSFLALIGVPFVLGRFRRNRLDPVGLMFVGAVAVYLLGWWTRHYELGRIVSSVGLTLHLAMGQARAEGGEEAMADGARARPLARWMHVTTVGLLLIGAYFVRQGIVHAVPAAASVLPPSLRSEDQARIAVADLRFLSRFVANDDVVLADRETSWLVPAYAGKVVSVLHPLISVADLDERAIDAGMFFEPYTTGSFRRTVIRKYHCRWLLLPKRSRLVEPSTVQDLAGYGETVYATESYVLVRLPGSIAP